MPHIHGEGCEAASSQLVVHAREVAGWWRWWGESTQGPAVERCGEGPREEPHGSFTASRGGGKSQVKEQHLSTSWFDSLEV